MKKPIVGEILTPDPEWNESLRPTDPERLPNECEVLEVSCKQKSETGFMVKVLSVKNVPVWLDRDWFLP